MTFRCWAFAPAFALAPAACMSTAPTNQLLPHRTSNANAGSGAPVTVQAPDLPDDRFVTLKNPADAHAELCTADSQHPAFPDDADLVTKTFCQDIKPGGVAPSPHGLADLQQRLGLSFADPKGANGGGGNPGFAILGHSSALTARKVSSITPTAFVFTPPTDGSPPPGPYVILAYDPGEQFVEIASPFTHWLSQDTAGGRALLSDFHQAHGTSEDYGPIPAPMIDKADPSKQRTSGGCPAPRRRCPIYVTCSSTTG